MENGGDLASIRSAGENQVVWQLCAPYNCWIGFSDEAQEGSWTWSDGSAADFRSFPGGLAPWNPGQPDNSGLFGGDSDAAYMFGTSNEYVRAGTWDDSPAPIEQPCVSEA